MQAAKIRDYRRIFRELGMSDFELTRALVSLRKGKFPRYILETVLRNDTPEISSGFFNTGYMETFMESVGEGLRRDRVDPLIVMADAKNYAEERGLDSERLFEADSLVKTVSLVFADYFRIKHQKDIEER
ncbi:hypothetical protein A3K73_09400 [Candidatus Pacearchaeota archaeon RBG_13_36_9]|nr:MAG: hypothetical protein A3K73_09400 [Candidatus Pacearchaeota archaeon RBG_13_36_9]